jgi:hypothetical protein
MKNLKVKLASAAIILGLGAAFATAAPHRFSNKTWGKEPTGGYIDVTGQHQGTDYTCSTGTTVCTAVYPATQDPNVNPANPISTVLGVFGN